MQNKYGFIIDLDGTIYKGSELIQGADEFIEAIREQETPFLFMTNNSSRTPEMVAEHLQQLGIDAQANEVYTAAQAAAQYIVERKKGNRAAFIGEIGLERALQDAGIEIDNERPDYLVQGIDREFSYKKLKLAVQLIRGGAEYIVTNPDLLVPSDDGLVPGAGSISASIKAASQAPSTVIGKPSRIIMNYAIQRIGLTSEQVWVVGDNLQTDIGAGKAAGCRTALVLTGIAARHNFAELEIELGIKADLVCDNLLELIDLIKG